MWQVIVDRDQCTGCAECVDGCPGEVYELIDKKAVATNGDECHGCHTCEELCDPGAITILEE